MKAMIFAAGMGTRLKPITDTLPKALVPVCGKPLLCHVLRKLQGAGISEVVINVHHFADKIEAYLSDNENFDLNVRISDERAFLLETGGGILHARDLLLEGAGEGDVFLAHNVDIVSDLDVEWFCAQARPGALATLLVSERQTQRYLLFDDDMRLVGWTNVATGEVRTPFKDLDVASCRRYAFAGIHLISNRVFDVMEEWSEEERFAIVDFYLGVCSRYPIYGAVPQSLTMVDVGKIDTLAQAEELTRRIISRSFPED